MAKVLLKKSSVSSNVPSTGDLDYGEVAINYTDGRLYYKNSSNVIKNFIDSDLLVSRYGTTGLDSDNLLDILTDPSLQLLDSTGSVVKTYWHAGGVVLNLYDSAGVSIGTSVYGNPDDQLEILDSNGSILQKLWGGFPGSVTLDTFASLSASIIPAVDSAYDLGSSSKKWKDLYLSGNSIYLGNAIIRSNGAGIVLPVGSTIDGGSLTDSSTVISLINSQVDKSFVDALNVNSSTLNSQSASYYLNYNNFTNTPTIPTSGVDFDPVGTDNSTNVSLSGSYDYLTIAGQTITLGQIDAATDITGLATIATTGAYSDLSGTPTNVSSFTNDANYLDSSTVTGVINTSYIQSNQIKYNTSDFADSAYVNSQISALVASAPSTLDTLNELAAALGDDPNFATTVTNSIATKLPLAGGTMSGTITFAAGQLFDGRDVSADGSKLDGIEAGATADQTASEILTAIKTVDGATSGLDADLLDNQHGSHYLDYNNFTNTPTIPVSGVDFDPVGTDNSTNVTLAGSYDYLTISGQEITLGQVDASTDITGLATVATSGAYGDLTGTPTNISTFTNDANYLDSATVVGVINSSYVQSNQITYNTSDFPDSAGVSAIVESYGYSTTTGTVTSVAATVPTGFTISGSPITSSGTLAISYDTGYQGYTSTEASKLAGIEAGATGDQTASEILTAIKTVDGTTSGLDADLLDGQEGTYYLNYNNFTNTPTALSAFTNDTNYLDSNTVTGVINSSYIQSNQIKYNTSNFTDSSYVSNEISSAINNLIDGAPGTLDTLNEIAAAINDDANAYTTLVGLINAMPDSAEVASIVESYGYSTTTGTVTSVAATVPTGFAISGSPITSSGTLAITYDTGYQGFTTTEASKLSGIEAGATADQTASEILTAIKTVDGTTSGLDADLLDGQEGSYYLNYNNFTNTPTIPTALSSFTNDTNYLDSTTVQGVINSSYIQSNQVKYNTSNFADSAYVTSYVSGQIGSSLQAYDANLTSFVSTFNLPTSDGSANQVLKTDGAGTLSFVDQSSGGGALDSDGLLDLLTDPSLQLLDSSGSVLKTYWHAGGVVLNVYDSAGSLSKSVYGNPYDKLEILDSSGSLLEKLWGGFPGAPSSSSGSSGVTTGKAIAMAIVFG